MLSRILDQRRFLLPESHSVVPRSVHVLRGLSEGLDLWNTDVVLQVGIQVGIVTDQGNTGLLFHGLHSLDQLCEHEVWDSDVVSKHPLVLAKKGVQALELMLVGLRGIGNLGLEVFLVLGLITDHRE